MYLVYSTYVFRLKGNFLFKARSGHKSGDLRALEISESDVVIFHLGTDIYQESFSPCIFSNFVCG